MSWDHAGIAVPIHRAFGDGAGADALVIAAGEQRGPRRRADRGRMEGVVADALTGDARQRGRVDRPAVGVGQAEADIVQQDDQNVGRVLRQVALLDAALVLGVLKSGFSDAGGRRRGKWQNRTVVARLGPPVH